MRLIGLAVGLAVSLTLAPLANAQQAWQIPRIGFLRTAAPPESYIEAFRQGLKERGYIEGKNIAFEYRWGGGRTDQLPELAAELVRLKVDVVVVEGVPPALAARKASITIPIVMASSGDPVGTGLIVSLARPGGNISGLTSINAQLGGKILELLKEVVPNLTHVAVLGPVDSLLHDLFLKNTEAPARALGLKLTSLRFRGPNNCEPGASGWQPDGIDNRPARSNERKAVAALQGSRAVPRVPVAPPRTAFMSLSLSLATRCSSGC
jgi:putative ABC transport system substrate-binding protein